MMILISSPVIERLTLASANVVSVGSNTILGGSDGSAFGPSLVIRSTCRRMCGQSLKYSCITISDWNSGHLLPPVLPVSKALGCLIMYTFSYVSWSTALQTF